MSETIIFEIEPCAKPRMTQSDKWIKRPATTKYWSFKEGVKKEAKRVKYKIEGKIEIEFRLSMPKSWSEKKKFQMDGRPHESRPDLDNLLKSWMDCLCKEDSFIHTIKAKKLWARSGSVFVRNL